MSGIGEGVSAPSIFAGDRCVRVVHLDAFEPAAAVAARDRDAFDRRFATLFDDGSCVRRGGLGEVRRVSNIWGETFALKVLIGSDPSGSETRLRAFRREYRIQSAVSGLRGFPKVHGIGLVDGAEAILMEWVEGVTLAKAARMLAVDDEDRISPLNAARIGRDLFDLLARLSLVEDGVVHGDISCANVMVRTDRMPLGEQADEGIYDLCLIDFGSAWFAGAAAGDGDGSASVGSATAEYAPPELLDAGCASDGASRPGVASDAFAAAGVVFRLASGRYPFDLPEGDAPRAELRRIKEQRPPSELRSAHAAADVAPVLIHEPEVAVGLRLASDEARIAPSMEEARLALLKVDAQLDPLIVACLDPDPARRPGASDLRDALGAFAFNYAANLRRALAGEPIQPCVPGSLADGYGAAVRFRRKAIRAAGKALCVAVGAATLAVSAALVACVPHAYAGFPPVGAGFSASLATAGALAVPFAMGLVLRWRDDGGWAPLARGCLGVVAGSLLSSACIAAAQPIGGDLTALLAASLGVEAASAFAWMAMDRIIPVGRTSRRSRASAAHPGIGASPSLSLYGSGEGLERKDH